MSDQQKTADPPAEEPYAPPAAGGDPDSRVRELKTAMAAAQTRGDTDTVQNLRTELEGLVKAQQREVAAATRKAAAETSGDPDAAHKPPVGRTTTGAKATTKQADPGKGSQTADETKK